MINNEQELFDLIKKNIIPDLEKCEDQMSKYDCYSKEHNIDIELKCRRTHYDDLLIERIKYNALIMRAEKNNTTAIYINSTPKGVWSFKLNDLNSPSWENRFMPQTTDFHKQKDVLKEVGYYNISVGKNLTNILI